MTTAPILLGGCPTTSNINTSPTDLDLLNQWSGDYPVSEIDRLPEGQQDLATGYIGNSETFIPVWRAFMPEEILPVVDFSKNIVVFSRNVQFYNRTSIFKVTLENGTAEIMAMETMSALPIEKKVAMGLAVIPRAGITVIKAGTKTIKVLSNN